MECHDTISLGEVLKNDDDDAMVVCDDGDLRDACQTMCECDCRDG